MVLLGGCARTLGSVEVDGRCRAIGCGCRAKVLARRGAATVPWIKVLGGGAVILERNPSWDGVTVTSHPCFLDLFGVCTDAGV